MKKSTIGNAVACTGAVIGAGFASGREIVSFFSQYGMHGWWLIALASAVMSGLCLLCMNRVNTCDSPCWCAMYEKHPSWVKASAQLCTLLLMILTAGAMISASGRMIAMIWPNEWAYSLGAAGTLAAAYLLSYGSMRPLTWLSGLLTVTFAAGMTAAAAVSGEAAVTVQLMESSLSDAPVRTVAYAAMNLTLAIGVVCRCAETSKKTNRRTALLFGLLMASLMGISYSLYVRHPEWRNESFPIVRLLSCFGRDGFLLSAGLVYLSVFTSLTSVIYALRCAAKEHIALGSVRLTAVLGLPAVVSCIGFEGIVDRLYAPAGLCCLAAVFLPLFLRRQA